MEIPLEILSSRMHPELRVTLQQGRLQLSTPKAIYSFGDLYINFRRAFSAIRLNDIPIEQVLLLGLGLGSIPEMLEKKFGKRYHYTVVEIDEAIIDLAQRYTLSHLHSGFEIYCADAVRFVYSAPKNEYQLICVDLFIDDLIPEPITEISFIEALAEALSPGGVLIFNCFALEESDKNRARWVFEQRFLPVFPEGTFIDVGSNWMLINDRSLLRNPPLP